MFGKRGLFGKRAAPSAPLPPIRQAGATPAGAPVGFRVFPKEVFEGKAGDMLRELGFDPDHMGNIIGSKDGVDALLADDDTRLREAVAAVNRASSFEIVPRFLLPPEFWNRPIREFLVKQLDLSPFRPWNVLFLPTSAAGAKSLGLPTLADTMAGEDNRDLVFGSLEEIQRIFGGANDGPAKATDYMFSLVRGNNPDLFPADSAQFTMRVKQARANVRTLAVSLSGIPVDVIRRHHKTFLGKPGEQLIA